MSECVELEDITSSNPQNDRDGVCEDGETCSEFCEECDDGNPSSSDTCTTRCLAVRCGDGTVQRAGADGLQVSDPGAADDDELCDDGNDDNTDSCTSACRWNACGDGVRYLSVSDEGNPNSVEVCDAGQDYREAPPGTPWLYASHVTNPRSAAERDDDWVDPEADCSRPLPAPAIGATAPLLNLHGASRGGRLSGEPGDATQPRLPP